MCMGKITRVRIHTPGFSRDFRLGQRVFVKGERRPFRVVGFVQQGVQLAGMRRVQPWYAVASNRGT